MSAATVLCQTCGCTYEMDGVADHGVCPRCAADVLRRRNVLGVLIAVLAAAVLVRANSVPFMVVNELGDERAYTILGGSVELFSQGNPLLGGVIFVFSFLFPFVKLLMLLLAAGMLPGLAVSTRRVFQGITLFVGKWSMLDVFVVAAIIVILKMGDMDVIRGLMDVQAGPGVVWFCAAVLLSGVAGFCMAVPEADAGGQGTEPTVQPASGTGRRRRSWLTMAAGVLLTAAGLAVALYVAPSAQDVAMIRAVRVSDASILPPILRSTYDLYLELETAGGVVTTKTEPRAVLGNGLTFVLPEPIAFRDIRSISAWDARESSLWDKIHRRERLDQVNEFGFTAKGTRFRFTLLPTEGIAWQRWKPLIAGYTMAGAGLLLMIGAATPWLQGRRD
jgi:hypothetical protein